MITRRFHPFEVSEASEVLHLKLWAGPTTVNKVFDYSLNGNEGTWQGAELVTNGDFSAWSGVADPDNLPDDWTRGGSVTPDASNKLVDATNACQLISDGSLVEVTQIDVISAGKQYTLSITISAITGALSIQTGQTTHQTYTTTGTKTLTFTAAGATLVIKRSGAGPHDITFTDVSVRESLQGSYPGVLFDGVTDHIVIDDATIFTPALTPFSIEAWVNMNDATNFPIASKGIEWTSAEWEFGFNSLDRLVFEVKDNSSTGNRGRFHATSLESLEGAWHHVAATYDGGTSNTGIFLYLDGIKLSDTGIANNIFISVENLTTDVHIGRLEDDYADGLISDVRLYSVVRTAAQVRDFYEQTRWRYGS